MAVTTRKQKIWLALFGVFLSLVILEFDLRLGGLVFMLLQDQGNRATFQEDEIRVLCIGESTTALGGRNSYPVQLEAILSSRRPDKKFKVINKGLVSKTSTDILRQLEKNLERYKPAIIVAMIGINDPVLLKTPGGGDLAAFKVERVFAHFRTYHLFQFLVRHIKAKAEGKGGSPQEEQAIEPGERDPASDLADGPVPSTIKQLKYSYQQMETVSRRFEDYIARSTQPESKAASEVYLEHVKGQQAYLLIRMAKYYTVRGDYKQAEKYLRLAITEDPKNYGGYVELARCYMGRGDYYKAVGLLSKARELNPKGIIARMELAQCYDELGLTDKAYDMYKDVFYLDPRASMKADSVIGNWLMENEYYEQAAVVLQEAVKENPTDFVIYEWMGEVFEKMGKTSEAERYYAKGKKLKQKTEAFLPVTVHNYNEIAEMAVAQDIKLICMQYPLRDIGPLKEMFWADYPIIFVENKTNFEVAVEREGYSAYFSDAFAGVFGHCTGQGNHLIAENLAEVILVAMEKK